MSGKKLDNETVQLLKLEVEKTFEQFKMDYPNIVDTPMRDSITKIEALGIFVLIAKAPDEVSGFCITIGEDTFIFVNKNHVIGRRNFSLWHEVYHWYTHSTGSISLKGEAKNNEIEFSADYFSSLVLVDINHLKNKLTELDYDESNINYLKHDDIIKLQHHFEVSYSAMVSKVIEIYPYANLRNRYALGNPNRSEELIDKTITLGLDISLISPSENTYVSSELFDLLKILLADNKITQLKAESIISILEGELD